MEADSESSVDEDLFDDDEDEDESRADASNMKDEKINGNHSDSDEEMDYSD